MKYIIKGKPIPFLWKRFNDRIFNARSRSIKAIREELIIQHGKNPLIEGPIKIELDFYFVLSKRAIKRGTEEDDWYDIKPDLTNCQKFIEDCMSGIIFSDDAKVCWMNTKQRYSEFPRTEFTVVSLKDR